MRALKNFVQFMKGSTIRPSDTESTKKGYPFLFREVFVLVDILTITIVLYCFRWDYKNFMF